MSLTPEMMPAWELLPIVKEQAVRIAQLEAALREIDQARYTGRNTISPDNAFENAISLNEKLIAVMDIARAALAQETPCTSS